MRVPTLATRTLALTLTFTLGLLAAGSCRAIADNAAFALAPKSASIAIDARGLTELLAAGKAASVRPALEAVAGRDAVITFDVLSRRCRDGADTIAQDVFSGRVCFSLSPVEQDAAPDARRIADAPVVWMFGIEADNTRCERALTLLGAKLRSPGWFDAAAERIIIRRAGGWLLIAPMPHGEALLEAASQRINVEDAAVSLLGEPLIQQLLVSDAPVRVFVRHDQPIGGATCIGVRAREHGHATGLRAEVDGNYDAAPIGRVGEEGALDKHLVNAFEDRAVMVMSNPCTGAPTKGDAYWLALLPELAAAPAMQANLSGERVMVVGQCATHAAPAMAVAWRVEDAEQAHSDQEHFMQGLLCGLARANEVKSEVKSDAKGEATTDSTTDASPANATSATRPPADHALGRFFDRYLGKPFKLSQCELCWSTVRTPCGGWQVYASDPEWLNDVSARLLNASCSEDERPSAGGIGFCDGPRAAALLRRWQPFVGGTQASEASKRTLHGIRALANTIEQVGRVRFEYDAPLAGRVHAVIDFEPLGSLTPANESIDRTAGVRSGG